MDTAKQTNGGIGEWSQEGLSEQMINVLSLRGERSHQRKSLRKSCAAERREVGRMCQFQGLKEDVHQVTGGGCHGRSEPGAVSKVQTWKDLQATGKCKLLSKKPLRSFNCGDVSM